MRKVEMKLVPFEHRFADGRVAVVHQAGVIKLHPDIAEAAIAAGAASAVDSKGSKRASRSTKAAKLPILKLDDATTLASEPDGMDRADLAGDDRADGELPSAASE